MVGWDNTVTLKRLHLCKRSMKWMFVWCEWKTEEVGWEIKKNAPSTWVCYWRISFLLLGRSLSFFLSKNCIRIERSSSEGKANHFAGLLRVFFRFACKPDCCVYKERVHDGCGRGMKASVEVVVCVCREKLETGTDCCVFGLSVHDEHVRRCFVENLFFTVHIMFHWVCLEKWFELELQ